jgi:TP901 family phage tail tape measure protein
MGKKALSMASDFQRGMANVSTLVNTAETDMKALSSGVLELSTKIPQSAELLTQGLYQVISAGIEAGKAIDFLAVAGKAATAGLATTEEAVNALVAVIKGYGMEAREATKVSDILFKVVKLGQTTFAELSASIGRVVPLAATLGIEVEELMTGFATLTGVTGNTAEVSTQLAAIMRAMIKPTEDMEEAVKKLGFSTGKQMLSSLGLVGALNALIETTDGTQEAIGRLFGRAEALTAVFALTGSQADIFRRKLDEIRDAAGATEEAFAKQMDTFSVKLEIFKNVISKLWIDFGEKLLPILGDIVDKLSGMAEWIGSLSDETKELIVQIGLAATALGTFVAAFTSLYLILPKIITSMKALGAFLLTNPFGIAVTSVTALTTAFVVLYKKYPKIREFLDNVVFGFRYMYRIVENVIYNIKGLIEIWVKRIQIAATSAKIWRLEVLEMIGLLGEEGKKQLENARMRIVMQKKNLAVMEDYYKALKESRKEDLADFVEKEKAKLKARKKVIDEIKGMEEKGKKEKEEVVRTEVEFDVSKVSEKMEFLKESEEMVTQLMAEQAQERDEILMGFEWALQEKRFELAQEYIDRMAMMGAEEIELKRMYRDLELAIEKEKADKKKEIIFDYSRVVETVESTIESRFEIGLANMIRGANNFRDVLKSVWFGIREVFIQEVSKMIVKWEAFQAIIGATKAFTGGILGMVGKILGFQTAIGQWRTIPGRRDEAVPIIAHGGEVIGRPEGGIPSMVINVNISGVLPSEPSVWEQIARQNIMPAIKSVMEGTTA